jgi:hypothetical protein
MSKRVSASWPGAVTGVPSLTIQVSSASMPKRTSVGRPSESMRARAPSCSGALKKPMLSEVTWRAGSTIVSMLMYETSCTCRQRSQPPAASMARCSTCPASPSGSCGSFLTRRDADCRASPGDVQAAAAHSHSTSSAPACVRLPRRLTIRG